MKRLNFWRTLFFSMMAVTAFVACSSDDSEGSGVEPSITVNGKEAVTVAHDLSAGTTEAVEVVSAGKWTLVSKTEGSDTWCTPSVNGGNGGTTQLTFELGATNEARTAVFDLSATGELMGYPITKHATVTVMQNGSGSTTGESNVAEVRALVAAMNPTMTKVDASAEILALGDIIGVISGDPGETPNMGNKYLTVIQDVDNAENSGLMINHNNVSTWKTGQLLKISLAGAQVQKYNGTLQLSLSNSATVTVLEEGVEITPVELASPADIAKYESQLVTLPNVQTASEYAEGTTYAQQYNANFVTDKGESFVVRTNKTGNEGFGATAISNLSGPIVGVANCYQSDNAGAVTVQLFPRNAEDVAGLTNPRFTIQSSSATISEILAGGEGAYKVENATVMAVTQRSFVIQDATGAILVFRGYNKEIPEVGSVVTLDGQVTTFNQALQFDASATVTKTGTTTVTEPSATEVNASNIQSIIDANKVVFVKLPGELFKDGDYYNMTLPFDSSHTGSIDAPAESLNIDSYLNQMVDAYGWFIYTTGSGARFTIAATKFVANTTTPSVKFDKTSLSFAATGAEPQKVGFTAQNVTGSVDMSIEGTDADKFSITAQDASSVTVSVAGDNTTDAAFTAQLVAKVGSETLATVELTQAKAAAAGAETIELDFTTSSYDIPGSSSKTEQTFSTGGYTFKYRYLKYYTSGNYVMFDAKSNEGSYLTVPAISGKKLVKVTITNRKGASSTAQVAIYPEDSTTAVAGGEASEWPEDAQMLASDLTFNLTGTDAGVAYRIYAIKGKNAQAVKVVLEYE